MSTIPGDAIFETIEVTNEFVTKGNVIILGPTATIGSSGSSLGFYGAQPVAQISGSTLTTVSELVAAFQSMGLLGP